MTTATQPSLSEATRALAEWRKRAEAGAAAVPNMRAAVERMNAAAKVSAILKGRGK